MLKLRGESEAKDGGQVKLDGREDAQGGESCRRLRHVHANLAPAEPLPGPP
jgi:hypothetical protein